MESKEEVVGRRDGRKLKDEYSLKKKGRSLGKSQGRFRRKVGGVKELWGEMKRRVRGILKKGCKVKEKLKRRGWWNKE